MSEWDEAHHLDVSWPDDAEHVHIVNEGSNEARILLVGDRWITLSPHAGSTVRRVIVAGQHRFCDCEAGCRFCEPDARDKPS